MLDIVKTANAIGLSSIAIVDEKDKELSKISTNVIRVSPGPEEFTPITFLLPLQMFAHYIALRKGHNPDLVRKDEPKYLKVSHIVFPPGTH
jgi:glucosamine 6-phosphate synthetase-like amidotransferase/phosphosugar isomerase protein